jgi:ubiquinone/menaquinone biosynthesis C-methylase UbiE
MSEPGSHKDQVLDQFTQQAKSYAQLTTSLQPHNRSDDLALFGALPDDLALDVACGSGGMAIPIAARVKHVTAIDLTPAMIEQGKARQAEKGLTNIDWIVGDVDPLPFGTDSFSLVMCGAAVHHFEGPAQVFREMVRVCRPGGRIVVRDLAFAPDKGAVFDAMERKRDPSHMRVLSLDELRALAEGLDVAEVAVEPYVTPPLPVEAILATSFPTECTIDDIRAVFRQDADSGEDRLGLQARFGDGVLYIAYPMATLVWRK